MRSGVLLHFRPSSSNRTNSVPNFRPGEETIKHRLWLVIYFFHLFIEADRKWVLRFLPKTKQEVSSLSNEHMMVTLSVQSSSATMLAFNVNCKNLKSSWDRLRVGRNYVRCIQRWKRGTARICCCGPVLSPAAVQQSIDISYLPVPLQQTRRPLLQRANETDRRTDTVPFHRPYSAYYASSASKQIVQYSHYAPT